MVVAPLLDAHSPRPSRVKRTAAALSNLQAAALRTLAGTVAPSTWSSRITVWKDAHRFLRTQGIRCPALKAGPPRDPSGLVLWLHTVPTASTRYAYAKALKAWYATYMMPVPPLLDRVTCALGRAASRFRPKQAWPISKRELLQFARTLPPWTRLGVWLAWKTHSRWSEISRLTRRCFLRVHEEGIVIAFATHHTPEVTGVKTAHISRFKMRHFVVVVASESENATMSWACRMLMSVPALSSKKLFDWTTARLETAMAKIPLRDELKTLMREEAAWPDPPRRHLHYTAHSIKMGAMEMTTRNVALGLLPPSAIPAIAKHKSAAEVIPDQSVRYTHQSQWLAFAGGTQHVTALV